MQQKPLHCNIKSIAKRSKFFKKKYDMNKKLIFPIFRPETIFISIRKAFIKKLLNNKKKVKKRKFLYSSGPFNFITISIK